MADPENVGNDAVDPADVPTTEDDRSLLQKAGDILGLRDDSDEAQPADDDGGDITASETAAANEPDQDPIVTDEVREQTAAEVEVDRKRTIRKNMAGNLGEKTERGKAINAGRHDPRTQPDSDESVGDELTEE